MYIASKRGFAVKGKNKKFLPFTFSTEKERSKELAEEAIGEDWRYLKSQGFSCEVFELKYLDDGRD